MAQIQIPKYIYFDAGNVLVEGSIRKKPAIAKLLGIPADKYDEVSNTFIQTLPKEIDNKFWRMRTIEQEREYVKEFNYLFCKYLNFKNIDQTVKDIEYIWFEKDCYLKGNALKVVAKLSTQYKMGIITNATPVRRKGLERLGLSKYMNQVIISCEEGLYKPDKEIYKMAIQRSKTMPQDILYIDDHEKYLNGAINAGITNLLQLSSTPSGKYRSIEHIDQLLELL